MAKQVKTASKPTVKSPVTETELTTIIEPIVENPEHVISEVVIPEIVNTNNNSINKRITQIEEMLKRKWSGWRVQKFKRELEDLKSQL